MNPESPAPDIDPLAPRADDPEFFRGRRLTDSPRAGGSPLKTLAVVALALGAAFLCVWLWATASS